MTLGPILFGAPWALAALAALPILWWLMRATPPPPVRAIFPPARLLLGLKTDEQSRERAPLWLVLFRALAAAMMIIGFARPSLAPEAAASANSGGRVLIVIDDGWTSAPFWGEARNAAVAVARDAERAGAQVHLLPTARQRRPRDVGEAMTGADARARLGQLEPSPWRPDRKDARERLAAFDRRFNSIVWITDGLADGDSVAFAAALQQRGPVTARLPARTARIVSHAATGADGVELEVRRGPNGGRGPIAAAAEAQNGRALGATEIAADGDTARGVISLPPEIARRATRVRIVGEQSAGAVRLLPDGSGRPNVGLATGGGEGQPLLSELFYVERALQPYATLQKGEARQLIDARVQAIIAPDASGVPAGDRSVVIDWVERGGLLIRFAGPRLANDAEEPLPVRLRPGARSLGGALAWERPLKIGAFDAESPFAGLAPPADVAVRRQVLAEPASIAQARVWAKLEDGSPLVTAAPRGQGLVVLFHVTAGPSWSDLPLSGLFVDVLRRTLAFAGRAEDAEGGRQGAGPYAPTRLLDGYGAFRAPARDLEPIPAEAFLQAKPGPKSPPGLYERAGVAAAIDAASAGESLAPLALPRGVAVAGLASKVERPLAGWFLGLGALLIAIDLLIALALAGRLPQIAWRRGAAGAALFLIAASFADGAHAQQSDPSLILRLAYVRTGDARVDARTRDGLVALSEALQQRTSVEPGEPIGVDLGRDDLSALPFLYWAAPDQPRPLSDAALANLDRYLRIGGLLLIDTRNAGASGGGERPAAVMLSGFEAPPLEPVTNEHVLARAFYLLRAFPGRFVSTRLWGESGVAAEARDGVAALFVGDGDWAGAWASDVGLANGGRQRELALRFGVNIVMVALTGNYKADQVHVPALLERLGQEQRR